MILFVAVDLKQVSVLGRNFPWQKPAICPCCRQSHLSGHGFADTYFEGYPAALPMRRHGCPACGGVIKCRPQGYFARFQSIMTTIRFHLAKRIATGRWPCRASRGRHWLAALKRKALAHLGLDWLTGGSMGDMEARDKMCYAQYLAGMAFNNASLGHVHAMAHQLGGFYDLPHGVCNAILLPHVSRFNLIAKMERFVDIAVVMGENVEGLSTRAAATWPWRPLKPFPPMLAFHQV